MKQRECLRSKNGIPAHPEFIYRQSGEWCGWADFLGDTSPENEAQDTIENGVWAFIKDFDPELQARCWDDFLVLSSKLNEAKAKPSNN